MRHKFHLLQDEIKYKVQSADRSAHARNAIFVPITALSEMQIRDGPLALIAWQRQKGRHSMLRGEWRPISSWLSMIFQSYITQLLSYKDRNKKKKGWRIELWISTSLEKCGYTYTYTVVILSRRSSKTTKNAVGISKVWIKGCERLSKNLWLSSIICAIKFDYASQTV